MEFSRSRLIAKWPLSEESNYAGGQTSRLFKRFLPWRSPCVDLDD